MNSDSDSFDVDKEVSLSDNDSSNEAVLPMKQKFFLIEMFN